MTKSNAGPRFRLLKAAIPVAAESGGEDMIVTSAAQYRRITGEQNSELTGKALFDALRASPHHNVTFDRQATPMSTRDVDL